MKKYYIEVMFEDETLAALSKDGQIYRFDKRSIIADRLSTAYIRKSHQGRVCWYFNESLDRECAETDPGDKFIYINPSAVARVFGMPTIYGDEVE